VITNDREIGYVEVARAADGATLTEDEALSEFNIVRYVSARETYDPAELQANYELVYASSSRRFSLRTTASSEEGAGEVFSIATAGRRVSRSR
jgi:type IV secretory pathway component VirB8